MNTEEKFKYAEGIYHDAESLVAQGKTDEANELMDKAKGLLDEAESEAKTHESLTSLKERISVPVNTLPVSVEDQKAWNQNEVRIDGSIGNQKVSNSFKPAGYNDSLPAASQSAWVKSAYGQDLKDQAAAYEKAFETWVRSRSDMEFEKRAEPWMLKALSEGTDSAGKQNLPLALATV